MGAVVVGTDISIVVVGIPTTIVIHITVAVVIDAIVRDFAGVYPAIQVFVGPIGTAVDDGHHDGVACRRDTASGEFIPSLRQAHNGRCPLLAEIGVVGNRLA